MPGSARPSHTGAGAAAATVWCGPPHTPRSCVWGGAECDISSPGMSHSCAGLTGREGEKRRRRRWPHRPCQPPERAPGPSPKDSSKRSFPQHQVPSMSLSAPSLIPQDGGSCLLHSTVQKKGPQVAPKERRSGVTGKTWLGTEASKPQVSAFMP